jgi:putative transposase
VSVAPRTYYDAKTGPTSARSRRDAELGAALVQLWEDYYRVCGERKLWKAARRAGHGVGRDHVAWYMRAAGIVGVRRGKRVRTAKADLKSGRHPDLVQRKFNPEPEPVVGKRSDLRADLGSHLNSLRRTAR